eukprot:contig_16999_g4132
MRLASPQPASALASLPPLPPVIEMTEGRPLPPSGPNSAFARRMGRVRAGASGLAIQRSLLLTSGGVGAAGMGTGSGPGPTGGLPATLPPGSKPPPNELDLDGMEAEDAPVMCGLDVGLVSPIGAFSPMPISPLQPFSPLQPY